MDVVDGEERLDHMGLGWVGVACRVYNNIYN